MSPTSSAKEKQLVNLYCPCGPNEIRGGPERRPRENTYCSLPLPGVVLVDQGSQPANGKRGSFCQDFSAGAWARIETCEEPLRGKFGSPNHHPVPVSSLYFGSYLFSKALIGGKRLCLPALKEATCHEFIQLGSCRKDVWIYHNHMGASSRGSIRARKSASILSHTFVTQSALMHNYATLACLTESRVGR